MSFVVFKGERKLAELVLRAYGELKASDRKRAEAALVRANPHLAKLKNVAPGPVCDAGPRGPALLPRPQRVGLGLPGGDAEEGRHGRHRSRRIAEEVLAR